ncbi:MAG TPA: DUF5658 family protein [Vicinamibacterales bacterium]|jgi:hypothetical protein|nr:DUF5658 family protein [Vicinamibacterales bacterium]
MLIRASATLAAGIWIAAGSATASAQELDAPAPIFANLERYLPALSAAQPVMLLPSGDSHVLPQDHWRLRRPDRFETLCLTLAGLTVVDTITTSRALNSGSGRELNPILAPFASNTAALVATKAAVDVAAVYLARRIWRRNPGAAVNVLIASNAVAGIAVVKNVSVANGQQ